MAQRDVKNRIASVKNIQKITRAMEMVAAARLRRAESRISALRPYAGAIRRMTRQAAEAAGDVPALPILADRENEERVALLLVTADRGLAGAFNSQIVRAGLRTADEHEADGREVVYYATGRRGVSSLTFRNRAPEQGFTGFTERPTYANAREIANALTAAYVDGEVDRVEILYNGYISPMSQEVRRETLLPLQKATILEEHEDDAHAAGRAHAHALVDYEPEPEEILARLVPDYVEISIFRALLESTASELGARMTAMRSASDNAGDIIDDLTLEMNRARQAEITQEIMEVVAGAEALG
ncbi:ATP synthase F1 subunit gamma [Conexibacter sp. CPCC 206217]|uniref:ATP synthase F1 subunit gamma n=1 Tax=Conexibacter sp. CPCC 206217 TaxID=3064574 RepID=UPI002719FC8E|nr:ATP synthase F1 subunit gamma [Conexibacter sp. CPCC 206217]MDO8213098.1 ATP synthase F1 subunit gamma [Conexibacter sp. CPCC 206217]